MSPTQRYVSSELTHFVGKGKSDEQQYELLVHILNSKWLMHPPFSQQFSGNLKINRGAKISRNEMFSSDVVCFCDIPVDDFDFHMRKYSQFGISFLKSYLITKGANPVFYVANDSVVGSAFIGYRKRGDYFDEMITKCLELLTDNMGAPRGKTAPTTEPFLSHMDSVVETMTPTSEDIKKSNNPMDLFHFLCFQIFSYIIGFESSLPEEDEGNYYMEREWRVVGNINFGLEEVSRIIIPRPYAKRFREDVPQYYGQITFSG